MSFWWPWFCSKTFKNMYFSSGFEGAIEIWLGDDLEACLMALYLFWGLRVSADVFEPWPGIHHEPHAPHWGQVRWDEATQRCWLSCGWYASLHRSISGGSPLMTGAHLVSVGPPIPTILLCSWSLPDSPPSSPSQVLPCFSLSWGCREE